MADSSDIPEHLLQQLLADPEAVAALQELAGRANVETPVAEMAREEQVALIKAMIGLAQQQSNAQGGAPGDPSSIPDDLVDQIFNDPRADAVLRDIMTHNQLTGEPADLSLDVKRAMVQLLIDQGVISFTEE